jgi:2-polyprenyl-3-methyl-5-hydroxy-6-metoxy-1,4-benzoquinol methylase
MINQMHAYFHRPESGWDPVSQEYAHKYGENEWRGINVALLDELEYWLGGLAGKRVLDLGGGPGQYSVAFAERGAIVTWHDISRAYQDIARRKAREHGVEIRFSLGYLDEAVECLPEPFDLVFNRICWNYCFSDRTFADVLFGLVKPGGVGYIDTNHSGSRRDQISIPARFRTWVNDMFVIKIGHPFPPHGRLARLFLRKPVERLLVNYSSPMNDRLLFVKRADAV